MLDLPQSNNDGADAQMSPSPVAEEVLQVEAPDQLYEMIKDGDIGTLLPASEDSAAEVHSQVLVESNPPVSYLNDEREDYTGQGYMDHNLEKEEEEESASSSGEISGFPLISCHPSRVADDGVVFGTPALSEFKDPVSERMALLAQMKVLDAMLQRIEAEEQQRAALEGPMVDLSAIDIISNNLHVGDGSYSKRLRRPNPKYFDSEVEADFLGSGSSPSQTLGSYGDELSDTAGFADGEPLQNAGYGNSSSVSHPDPSSFFDRCSVRSAATHRTRTALAQKPRVFFSSEGSTGPSGPVENDNQYDNLSIKELHEAYREKFGRETSVKDKHWLKRQISMGLNKQNGLNLCKENTRGNPLSSEMNVRARLEKNSMAELPLSALGTTNPNGVVKGGVGSPGTSPEVKRSHRKTISLAVLLPAPVLNPSTAGACESDLGGTNDSGNPSEVQNTESPVGGKRLRKPNRRYIEDEGDGSLGVCTNGRRTLLSTYLSAANGIRPGPVRLSWRSDAEVAGHGYKNGALRSNGIRTSTRGNTCHGRRSKHGTNGVKRKSEGRAAKLIKMVHSARAAQHDVNGTVRKVKFRLPAAPGQDKGELLNGGNGEQLSCLLPKLTDESSEDYQILSSHYLSRLDDANEQAVVTVPTANGGTRRKHHRPWTLREVVTLVEGVARCGGGKWADIKKLAFSAVAYRTAVDLKDKWRNLLRASRAQLHPPKQGETRKKQFSASIPGHILTRVRELAAINNQMIPITSSGNNISRSGRTVHRR